MRESVGGTWLFGLVITFMLLFVAYLTVMINYSTAFKNKNEVVSIIEKYEGLSSGDTNSISIINNYLKNSGYNATGKCDEEWYGATSLDSSANLIEKADNAYYCVKYNSTGKQIGYFDVKLFLKFDLPVFGQIGRFKINGQTIKIHNAQCKGLGNKKGC